MKIVNNSNYGFNPYYQQTPYIGQIQPYGYNPYGSQYQYMNPAYYEQQHQAYEAQQKQMFQSEVNVWKNVEQTVSAYYGTEPNLSQFDSMKYDDFIQTQFDQKQAYDQMQELEKVSNMFRGIENVDYDKLAEEELRQANSTVKNENLLDYLAGTATDKYREVIDEKCFYSNHNVSKLYDSNVYNQLIGIHNSSMNSALNRVLTVDDISITLPASLAKNYAERRRLFMESVMNKTPSLGGESNG